MEFGPVIKNPVLDINKLVRQGTMLNQSVQNVEGDSTADQATVDLLARKDPVIQEIAVGMSGEELTQYTVSGTPPLSLPNSLGKPLKAWEVGLEPVQDLHGYDSPWPAGGGKNKLDTHTSSEITLTNNGVTFKLKDDIFTVSNEVTSPYPGVVLVSMGLPNLVLPAGTYRLYVFDDTSNYGARLVNADYSIYLQRNSDTTLTEEVTFIKLVSGTAMTGVTASGSFKLMVVDTSTGVPTAWSPYSNICPIHGTDKLTITTAGKNLFDQSVTPTTMDCYDRGGASINRLGYKIELPAGTYKLSATKIDSLTTAAYIYVCINNADDSYSSFRYFIGSATTSADTTIVLTEGQYFILYDAQALSSKLAWFNFQVEVGSTATPYTPYLAPSQTVLTLPQTVYTATIGSDGGESRTQGVILTGNETVTSSTVHGNSRFSIYTDVPTGFVYTGIKYCSHFTPSPLPITTNALDNAMCGYGTALYARADQFANATAFKTYLAEQYAAGTPVQFVGEMQTYAQFHVSAPGIPTPTGTATTWATAEDGTEDSMEVTYVGKA